ncbi:MAG TPA: XrtA/PEP-CTERM system histidine kinase PrsK [Rhizomicrobium sp.]|nr:XrtA/PEP-CTERM system histidine kinase PrsK [Rhizomicrobium sp.]
MTTPLLVWGHEAAFVAYVTFAVIVGIRGARTLQTLLFLLVMLATAAWAQSFVAVYLGYAPDWVERVFSAIRDASWLALSLGLMQRHASNTSYFRSLVAATAVLLGLQLVLGIDDLMMGAFAGVRLDVTLVRVMMTILGFLVVENVLRNSTQAELWALKHWAIGFSAILLFQLLSRIPEFLTHRPDVSLAVANPLVYVVALPFFVVSSTRLPQLKVRVHSSRTFIFHSTTLVAVGVMLQGIALAAWYVRTYGGSNGTALAVIVAFGGVAAVAALLVSSGVRSRVRRFINENFFSLKYDYRVEWEKTIRELTVNPGQDTAERVLRIVCDLMDTPGGAIWLYRESWRQYIPAAKRGDDAVISPVPEDDPRVEALRSGDASFFRFDDDKGEGDDLFAPWRRFVENAWIIVPMRYRSTVAGFAILNRPRAPRTLDWEDQSLVRLVAMQLAAHLVQEETAQSLADARQLEDFNKRFAFVVHDIKNTIGQLRLLVSNITKFGDVKEFRDDMVITLGNSVERLEGMLKSLTVVGQRPISGEPHQVVDLIDFLEKFTEEKCSLGHTLVFNADISNTSLVQTDFGILHRVLEHVVSNALEASPPGAAVQINATANRNTVLIAVSDQGSGMTQQFVNEELFRPLKTTKRGGFGIGGYQVRELMRDLGGDVTVESAVGQGTCVTLSLPLVRQ